MANNFKHFFIFGDSITYGAWDVQGGWVGRLRRFVDKKNVSDQNFYCLVYNLGISGNTTRDVLARFEYELKQRLQEEAVIVFAIGINDSAFVNTTQTHHVSLEQFKKNIESLIVLARTFSSRIIFVGLTPVDEAKTAPVIWDTSKSYKNEYIQQYNNALQEVTQENDVIFIDIFPTVSKKNFTTLTDDGLHPNSKGHQAMFRLIKKALTKQSVSR